METNYITVDLELKSKSKFPDLILELESKGYIPDLHKLNKTVFTSNVSAPKSYKSPEKCIQKYLEFINSLSKKSSKQFSKCHHKVLNIGYETSEKPFAYESALKAKTIKQIASLCLGLSITLYPLKES